MTQDHGEIDILEMIDGDGFAHATYHWENVTRCAQPYGHLSKTTQQAMSPNWGSVLHEYAVEFTVRAYHDRVLSKLPVSSKNVRPPLYRQPSYLAFVYDGGVVLNLTSTPGNTNKPVLWDVPYYLILNTASVGLYFAFHLFT